MDMRSLSNTLPGGSKQSTPPPPQNQSSDTLSPEDQLLQAFKSAATSVTLLYKSSASLVTASRSDGYCDALSDVLEKIDNESAYNDPALALSRIRDWVIDRRHESKNQSGPSGNMPPPHTSQQARDRFMNDDVEEVKVKEEGITTEHNIQKPGINIIDIPQNLPFTFQPMQNFPVYPDSNVISVPDDVQSPPSNNIFTFNSPPITGTAVRQSHSNNGTNKYPLGPRSSNPNIATTMAKDSNGAAGLGVGAGTKRKLPYIDFFDIGGFGGFGNQNSGPGNGGGGGGGGMNGNAVKRGRFS